MDTFNSLNGISISASKTRYGVKIYVPKFSFEYEIPLKDNLISLGITDAFNKYNADLKNMYNSEYNLYVSNALHKAKIDFTEKGVKAAAVTVFTLDELNMAIEPEEPIEIIIDKPFMFVIKDKKSSDIWFVGTVYKPNLWDDDKELYKKPFSSLYN